MKDLGSVLILVNFGNILISKISFFKLSDAIKESSSHRFAGLEFVFVTNTKGFEL